MSEYDETSGSFASRALKSFALFFPLIFALALFFEWPRFPATTIGWWFIVASSLPLALFWSLMSTAIGDPVHWSKIRSAVEFLKWLAFIAIVALSMSITERMFSRLYPDLRVVHLTIYR